MLAQKVEKVENISNLFAHLLYKLEKTNHIFRLLAIINLLTNCFTNNGQPLRVHQNIYFYRSPKKPCFFKFKPAITKTVAANCL